MGILRVYFKLLQKNESLKNNIRLYEYLIVLIQNYVGRKIRVSEQSLCQLVGCPINLKPQVINSAEPSRFRNLNSVLNALATTMKPLRSILPSHIYTNIIREVPTKNKKKTFNLHEARCVSAIPQGSLQKIRLEKLQKNNGRISSSVEYSRWRTTQDALGIIKNNYKTRPHFALETRLNIKFCTQISNRNLQRKYQCILFKFPFCHARLVTCQHNISTNGNNFAELDKQTMAKIQMFAFINAQLLFCGRLFRKQIFCVLYRIIGFRGMWNKYNL